MSTKTTNVHESTNQIVFFIGIDVHKKKWVITIRALGMELKTFVMNPSPKELAKYLHKDHPGGLYLSVYEAGFCGFWIHRELVDLGIQNRVIHAADVPTTHKEKVNKRDKVDSRKLARELEKGGLNPIYIPELEFQEIRSLARLRWKSSQHIARLKNRIKGLLFYYGIHLSDEEVSKHWSAAFIRHLETLCTDETASSMYLRICLDELKEQRPRLCYIARQLRGFCAQCGFADLIGYLLSVPGIGFVTAVTLATEIIDINRFKKLDHLASFVGLVPSTNSSGENERDTGLTPRKNKYLKHLVIEAAWIAMRKDPELLSAFNTLTKRMRKTDAIIRIARKLLNRVRFVWKNQTAYRSQAAA